MARQEGQGPCGLRSESLPVVQGEKVRRADDWLRGGHNSTVWAADCPPYQGTPTVASCIRRVPKTSDLTTPCQSARPEMFLVLGLRVRAQGVNLRLGLVSGLLSLGLV